MRRFFGGDVAIGLYDRQANFIANMVIMSKYL
jgi:hypothetical protein